MAISSALNHARRGTWTWRDHAGRDGKTILAIPSRRLSNRTPNCGELLDGLGLRRPNRQTVKTLAALTDELQEPLEGKRVKHGTPDPLAIASQPGVTDIAVTCDGTVWADCGQGMQEVCLLRRCFPSAQSIREFRSAIMLTNLGRRLDDDARSPTPPPWTVCACTPSSHHWCRKAGHQHTIADAVSPDLESLARNGMFPAEWLPCWPDWCPARQSVG